MNLINSLKSQTLPEGPMPELDRLIIYCLKLSYMILRTFCRLMLGRGLENRLCLTRKFWCSEARSVSYPILSAFQRYFGIRKGKDGSHLMKICVPKHNYKYISRIEKRDFTPNREEDILQHFTPKLGDVVVDVGAHIGRYTIISSKLAGPNGTVIAIEADPDNFDLLNENIALNGLSNVLPINCAAYSKQIEITLYRQSSSSVYSSVITTRAPENHNYVKVPARTLDEILHLNRIRKVNWIKIDVEGAEFEVLKGAAQLLSKSDDLSILVEIHNILDSNHEKNIINFLHSLNLDIEFVRTYDNSIEKHVIFRKSKVAPA